jgi:hypothetical protein
MLVQLTFESYDPQTYDALDFFLTVAKRLAELTDGVVADPVSQVYRLPEDVLVERPAGEPIAAADHVQAKDRLVEGTWHCYTLGLSKFHLPEVEMFGVAEANRATAARFLIGLAQSVLVGARLEPGATVGTKDAPLSVAVGGLDRGMWEGIPCVELIPAEGTTIDAALLSWYASVAK